MSYRIVIRESVPHKELLFDHDVSMDIMWLENTSILYFVETHTGFQNATFLRLWTAIDMSHAFVEYWATLYTGYPNIIRLDHEVYFAEVIFRELATDHGIML